LSQIVGTEYHEKEKGAHCYLSNDARSTLGLQKFKERRLNFEFLREMIKQGD